MIICYQNLYHVEELQKQAQNKNIKLQSYALSKIVWLSSKQLKAKQNHKLKAKFFGLFWVLQSIIKQAYRLKLLKE